MNHLNLPLSVNIGDGEVGHATRPSRNPHLNTKTPRSVLPSSTPRGARPTPRNSLSDPKQLLRLCLQNNLPGVKSYVLSTSFVDVNVRWKDGTTPLMAAARTGNMDIVRFLVEHKADIHVQNDSLISPLLFAVYSQNMELVEYLVKLGANTTVCNLDGANALIVAAELGNLPLVRYFIDLGLNINLRTEYNEDALVCACHSGNPDIVTLLLEKGAYSTRTYNDKYTALHVAAEAGHAPVLKVLLDNKADIHAITTRGDHALTLAAGTGRMDCVRELLQHGARINYQNKDGMNALMASALYGYDEITSLLLESPEALLNAQDRYGHSALMLGAMRGFINVVLKLANCGAHVHLKNIKGQSAHTLALMNGYTDIEIILRHADVEDIKNKLSGAPQAPEEPMEASTSDHRPSFRHSRRDSVRSTTCELATIGEHTTYGEFDASELI